MNESSPPCEQRCITFNDDGQRVPRGMIAWLARASVYIEFAVSRFAFNSDCVISCKDVEQAIKKLNPSKSDEIDGL